MCTYIDIAWVSHCMKFDIVFLKQHGCRISPTEKTEVISGRHRRCISTHLLFTVIIKVTECHVFYLGLPSDLPLSSLLVDINDSVLDLLQGVDN